MKTKLSYLGATFVVIMLLSSLCLAIQKNPDSHINGWILAGDNPKGYQSGIDKTVKYSGNASAFICSNKKLGVGKSTTLMQIIKSAPYKGKRIRMSAWVKTSNLNMFGVCMLWLETNTIENTGLPGGASRIIKSNTDWKQYNLVVDVDTANPYIKFGIVLKDTGKIWIDDVKIEAVDKDIPSTNLINKNLLSTTNLSFEKFSAASSTPDTWVGDNGVGYELTSDHTIFHDGKASASLKSIEHTGKLKYNFGTIMGTMVPDSFAGKRIRMTGWVKTEGIKKRAGLWMRIYGQNWGEILGYDDMDKRPIKGTTDWTKYEIVLDVPQKTTYINFGAILRGEGQLWLDEIKFEVVGTDVPSTCTYTCKGLTPSRSEMKKSNKESAENVHDSPINLDFEG